MDEQKQRDDLIAKITERLGYDKKWGERDFIFAQIFVWLAILASFFTAILAAADAAPNLVLAFLAAIPGTVIIIEKSFSFGRRTRWHWEMVAGLDELLNQLKYEGAKADEISKKLSSFRKEMEAGYPGMSVEGITERPVQHQ